MSKEMLSREEFIKKLTNNEKISSFRSFLESTQIKHNLSIRTNEELVNNLADIIYLPLSPVKLSSYIGLHDLLNNGGLGISLMNMIKDISDSAFSVVQKFRKTNKNLLDKVIQDNTSKLLFDVFVAIDASQVPVNEALVQLNPNLSGQLPQVVENNIVTTNTINMKEVIEKPTQIIVEDLSAEQSINGKLNIKDIKEFFEGSQDFKKFLQNTYRFDISEQEGLNDMIDDLCDFVFEYSIKDVWNVFLENSAVGPEVYFSTLQTRWKEILHNNDLKTDLYKKYPNIKPLIEWFIGLTTDDILKLLKDKSKSEQSLYGIFLNNNVQKITLFDNQHESLADNQYESLTDKAIESFKNSFKDKLYEGFVYYVNQRHSLSLSIQDIKDRIVDNRVPYPKNLGPGDVSTINLLQTSLHTLELSTSLVDDKDGNNGRKMELAMSISVDPAGFEYYKSSMNDLMDSEFMKKYRIGQAKLFKGNYNIILTRSIHNRMKKIDVIKTMPTSTSSIGKNTNITIEKKTKTLSYYERIKKRGIDRIPSHYVLTNLESKKTFTDFISRGILDCSRIWCHTNHGDSALLYSVLNHQIINHSDLMVANVSAKDIGTIYSASTKFYQNMLPTEDNDKKIANEFFHDVDVLVITDAEYFLSGDKAAKTREYLIDQFKGAVVFVSDELPKSSLVVLEKLIQKVALNTIDVPGIDKESKLKIFDKTIEEYNITNAFPFILPEGFKQLLVSFLPIGAAQYKDIVYWLDRQGSKIQLESKDEQLALIAKLLDLLMKPAFTFDEVAAFVEKAILGEERSRINDQYFKAAFAQYLYNVMTDRQNTYSVLPLYYGEDKLLTKIIKDRYGLRSIDTSAFDKNTQYDIKLTIEDEINKKVKNAIEL